MLGYGDAVEIHERGHQIDRRRQRSLHAASTFGARGTDDQRDVRQLVVEGHHLFTPVGALPDHVAVVSGQNDDRVVPHAVLVQFLHESAEPMVGHRERAAVAVADVSDHLLVVGLGIQPAVEGPGEVVAVPAVARCPPPGRAETPRN